MVPWRSRWRYDARSGYWGPVCYRYDVVVAANASEYDDWTWKRADVGRLAEVTCGAIWGDPRVGS